MESVEAYVDNYEMIQIEVARYFYNGEEEIFYAYMPDHTLVPLEILEKHYHDDRVTYDVKMFDGFEVGNAYYMVDGHGYRFPLNYRYIVRTEKFKKDFYYAGDDLGATYYPFHTTFKLWAPTTPVVYLQLSTRNGIEVKVMKRQKNGVFELDVPGNLDGVSYVYMIRRNGEVVSTCDPYAKGSLVNKAMSVVINPSRTKVDKYKPKPTTTPIIYEVNVRDFTSDLDIKDKATFKGFVQEGLKTSNNNKAGFDYLKTLGVTHLQFMPIFDFYTVDEENKFVIYNWGYDPIQFNVPEGSYASNPRDPYTWVRDLKEMVSKLHRNNFHVIMDVVYNHMYDRHKAPFDRVVPDYYFRLDEKGNVSNGSFCGNDFDSTMPMARKFIIDSLKYWVKEYDIDGFRFDLMGIIDYETMNLIEKEIHALKPDALIYGEGWNMPTMIPDSEKGSLYNAEKMPNVGFFNDSFRDVLKGNSGDSHGSIKGYLTGDLCLIDAMKHVLLGQHNDARFVSPLQSINYVECHDNATAYDKIIMCCGEEGGDNYRRRAKLLIAGVLLSQGIPFLQAGQEFCRTKGLLHNTYNSPDEVNRLDYERKDQYQDVVDFTRELILYRRENPCFNFKTYEELKSHVTFDNLGGILKYMIRTEHKEVVIYFNPTMNPLYFGDQNVVICTDYGVHDRVPHIGVAIVENNF